MARGLNKVMLIGNVGREPEKRYTPGGSPVTTFDVVVVSHTYTTPEGERREKAEWFSVVAWGRLAEICHKRLTKGQQVYIEGRLHTRDWEDAYGKKHFRTEVVAQEMKILGERRFEDDEDDFPDDSES